MAKRACAKLDRFPSFFFYFSSSFIVSFGNQTFIVQQQTALSRIYLTYSLLLFVDFQILDKLVLINVNTPNTNANANMIQNKPKKNVAVHIMC